ncbi:helix-turn-helix domain-containing protein [Aneurinibacillus sp. REN35]|uniref:helix-turn-helix domain-containing protein n=1 Tax=Aneurinibacillus sp. REN35 TaxID=3237286 RepID=UPI003527F2DB
MIGRRIRHLRRIKKLSLSQLAKRAGVSKSYLSFIERDLSTNPSIHFLEKIANVLDVSVNSMLRSEAENTKEADVEWHELTAEAISSGISKQEFRAFIECRKWKKQSHEE